MNGVNVFGIIYGAFAAIYYFYYIFTESSCSIMCITTTAPFRALIWPVWILIELV